MDALCEMLCQSVDGLAPFADVRADGASVDYTRVYVHTTEDFLLLICPYLPLTVSAAHIGFVDGYYNAYQTLYAAKRAVIHRLATGYPALASYHGSYKALLAGLGIGTPLANNLIYLAPFGTFFCVEVLTLTADAHMPEVPFSLHPACADCGRCAAACPGDALAEKTFTATRCVRQWQFDFMPLSDANKRAIAGNRLLGCNYCQLACPLNAPLAARRRTSDAAYETLFDLDTMARACVAPNFRTTEYARILGYNFAKPMKLLSHVLSAMLADNPQAHAETVKACLAAGNPNAKPLLREYLGIVAEQENI